MSTSAGNAPCAPKYPKTRRHGTANPAPKTTSATRTRRTRPSREPHARCTRSATAISTNQTAGGGLGDARALDAANRRHAREPERAVPELTLCGVPPIQEAVEKDTCEEPREADEPHVRTLAARRDEARSDVPETGDTDEVEHPDGPHVLAQEEDRQRVEEVYSRRLVIEHVPVRDRSGRNPLACD